ncbi:hypothetical protein F2P79_003820 [Pimephales promelas]|nr:hypothetical protein F2P79_003820 [Pimephales promelas]
MKTAKQMRRRLPLDEHRGSMRPVRNLTPLASKGPPPLKPEIPVRIHLGMCTAGHVRSIMMPFD